MKRSTRSRMAMKSGLDFTAREVSPARKRRQKSSGMISAMRPGRGVMMTSLVARKIASSTSWVMKNAIFRVRAQRVRISSWTCSRVKASSAPSGSSISSMRGSAVSARAMPTRCCMPPDSS